MKCTTEMHTGWRRPINTSEISSNNSEKLSLLTDKHLWTFLLHSSCSSSPPKKRLGVGQCSPAMLLSPNSFDSLEPVPEAKDLVVTFLSQPRSVWLIRLAKWNQNTIRYWTMQTRRIVTTLSHLRALHNALRETFLKVTNNEMLTAKRHRSQLYN